MKIGITGTTGLAAAIAGVLQDHTIHTPRIEDITMNGLNFWGFDKDNPNNLDVLINHAHKGFAQTEILDIAYRAWHNDHNKYIINISSRAHQPNISKGYMYATQKASLNHLSNNLVYNSNKHCRITTINLGLLNSEIIPSLTHKEVADAVEFLIDLPKHIEIPEITLQHSANYIDVQTDKEVLKQVEEWNHNTTNKE
tara:strand:+ start:424 stop:1014 length:591 start_codon:yes stop_codon:yes gene_type:complete